MEKSLGFLLAGFILGVSFVYLKINYQWQKKITGSKELFTKEKNKIIAYFLAGLLHKMAQPVTTIHGFAQFLKEQIPQDNNYCQPVCLMEEQSSLLKGILQELMDFIRYQKPRNQEIMVPEVIRRSLDLLEDELRMRRIYCEFQSQENLPGIFANRVYLQYVFMKTLAHICDFLSFDRGNVPKYIFISTQRDPKTDEIQISLKAKDPDEEEAQAKLRIRAENKKDLNACREILAEIGGRLTISCSSLGGIQAVIHWPVNVTA